MDAAGPVEDLESLVEDSFLDPSQWSSSTVATLTSLRRQMVVEQPTAPVTSVVDGLYVEDLTIVRGDLQVTGELELDSHLLVLGELTADIVTSNPEHNSLIVVGDLRCRVMQLYRTYLLVTGSVTASGCVHVSAYGKSIVVGGITTGLWFDEMWWQNLDPQGRSANNIRATHQFSSEYFPRDGAAADTLQAVLPAALFQRDEAGGVDIEHLVAQVKDGGMR